MMIESDEIEGLLEEKTEAPKNKQKKQSGWEEFQTDRGITVAKRRYSNGNGKWQFEYIGYFNDNISWETLPEKLHAAVEGALGEVVGEGGVTRNNLSRVGRMVKSDVHGIPVTSWIFDKLPPFDPLLSRFKLTIEVANDDEGQE